MEQTVFDVLENQFGTCFGPGLIGAVEDASYEQLRELQERIKAFGKTAEVPTKRAGELRPYIPMEKDRLQIAPNEMYLRADDFADARNADVALEALKHHLLYCHSLAIDNPLRWILDAFIIDPKPSMLDYLDRQRAKAVNFLRFLTRIEPLVRAHVVVLVEGDLELPFIQDGALRDTNAVCDAADFSDLPWDQLASLEPNDEMVRHALMSHANLQLACGLDAAAKHSEALDLYLPYKHYEAILRAIAQERTVQLPEWVREVELQVLSGILKVSLPGLVALEPQEIVAVREGDEGFARWRASLERGMDRVRALDPETINRGMEGLRVINEELLDGRQALEAEISKSSLLSKAKSGLREFSIGSVVALGLIPLAGPAAPLIGGAGNAGLSLLLDMLTGRRNRASAQALHHQYLLFSPGTSTNSLPVGTRASATELSSDD